MPTVWNRRTGAQYAGHSDSRACQFGCFLLFYGVRLHNKARTLLQASLVSGVTVLEDIHVRNKPIPILMTKLIAMFIGLLMPAL